ncbi:MAG: NADH-quinone oxidoreductase subunit C [Candidatus Marinimicrobia bacterium]|jgi:NADH-quinone oxidoreductase subunit C|nr:NADH-quinone oxidoreductase subunit C [Candidatus Neomarinimicrobiota bacterium]
MTFSEITDHIESKTSGKISLIEGKDVIQVTPDNWLEVATLLKDDTSLQFDYLMCISSYDKGNNKTYGAAYNFFSVQLNHYIEVRVEVEDGTSIPSVAGLWRAADWHEREAYDMMGLHFENHPDLKRILLSEDWEGYPLRKKYTEPDYYHGMPVPKDKSYWD